MAAAGMLRPVVFSILIASILVVFASYAFSALGFFRPLPALRVVLCAIGVGLSIRAVWLPFLVVTDPRILGFVCGRCSNLNGFVVATSVLCLFIGLGFLLGAWRLNPCETQKASRRLRPFGCTCTVQFLQETAAIGQTQTVRITFRFTASNTLRGRLPI